MSLPRSLIGGDSGICRHRHLAALAAPSSCQLPRRLTIGQPPAVNPGMGATHLLLALALLAPLVQPRPRPQNSPEVQPRIQGSPELGLEGAGVVGGQISHLVSNIYNDIIRARLKNLLEGISSSSSSPPPSSLSSSLASTLLQTSDSLERQEKGKEGELHMEVFLPKTVTEIPPELFASLPGTTLFHLIISSYLSEDFKQKCIQTMKTFKK